MSLNGILNINKASGLTSHDVVARVRRLTKEKRAGHAGTLDPAAEGVLPICLGQATRVVEYLSEASKSYIGVVVLGIETDTLDGEGEITAQHNWEHIRLANIEEALKEFQGPLMQQPPQYSAIKVGGRKLYEAARAGETIEVPSRAVTIHRLELLSWTPPALVIAVDCSKGTYIRALARDIGARLGTGGYLASLIRTRTGPFTLAETITLDDLALAAECDYIEQLLLPADEILSERPAAVLDEKHLLDVRQGRDFPLHTPPHLEGDILRAYSLAGDFIALLRYNQEKDHWHPQKVFAY